MLDDLDDLDDLDALERELHEKIANSQGPLHPALRPSLLVVGGFGAAATAIAWWPRRAGAWAAAWSTDLVPSAALTRAVRHAYRLYQNVFDSAKRLLRAQSMVLSRTASA